MELREIDLFLKAKRQWRYARRATQVALALVMLALVLLLAGFDSGWIWGLMGGAALGGLGANSELLANWGVVTRAELLDLIEAQINRDPEALRHLRSRGLSSRRLRWRL
jgi:hypothetical protein